jgi:hypothetical protein
VAYCILYDTTALLQPVFYVSFLECTIQNVLVIIILLFLAGTTVHPDWHRFLDNSFSTFNPNEYVALLLSEEQMNKDEYTPSVYVYAIIIRKCETTDCESNVLRNTLQMYEVKVGRGRIETFSNKPPESKKFFPVQWRIAYSMTRLLSGNQSFMSVSLNAQYKMFWSSLSFFFW